MGLNWMWMKVVVTFVVLILQGWWSEGCWEQERFALLQLKHFFNNPYRLKKWIEGDESLDCCQWESVECNNTTGRVIKLELVGTRNWELGEWYLNASLFAPFQELEVLDLMYSNIAGCLENEGFERLSKLSNLSSLYLYTNLFNNSILPSLGNLSSLRELYLMGNKLNGTIDIKDYKGLKKLNVLGLGPLPMTNILLQLLDLFPSLKSLHLSINNFDERMITQELPNLTNLESLSLDCYSLRSSLLESSIFAAFTSIKSLVIWNCQLDGSSNFRGFSNLKHLEDLSLYGVKLQNGFLQISKSMASLKSLTLSSCGLKGAIIDQGFCEMTNLQTLFIYDNELDGILPWCLANLTSLQRLDISYNQISGDISSSPLRYLTSIQDLGLSNNQFQIPISLEPFYNHSNLKSFYGDMNQIYENSESYSLTLKFQLNSISLFGYGDCGTFPKFLYHQHELKNVYLSHINLTGEFPNWLLENNTKLESLYLVNNSISGPFRMPDHSHGSLREINVAKNFIQRHIPLEIGAYFPSLLYFNISQNDMNGSIPSSFGDMKLLKSLDLSHNQLSGGIPEHLAMGCFSLEILVLSNNSLQGHIFSRNFNLKNLYWLELDDNQFTGEIPESLSNSFLLKVLYLNGNHISGKIPGWLGSMSRLVDIVMPNNHLEGPIPMEFCKLHFLQVLDLSNNNISGSLPSCLSLTIQQVHLSRNKIDGQLKDVSHNNSTLVTLDLSYNCLNGIIPNNIDRLSQLRYLILAYNNLKGEVPMQLCHLNQIRLIDLSHNDLSGQIPSCLDNTTLGENYDDAPTLRSLDEYMYFHGEIMSRKEETIPFTTKSMSYYYHGRILVNMSGVDLSCNKLTGEIPFQIGNLTEIHALNLSHNNLTGPIPATFSNLKQIESLDISYNYLNGEIPPQLVELNALAVFSVAHNNLSGKMPERIAQFGTFDESSYEGNYLLCGPPLRKSCNEIRSPSLMPKASTGNGEYDSLIDIDSFYVTFVVSYIILFSGTILVLYLNSYWRQKCFYFVESCYYIFLDHLPKRFFLGN